MTSANKHDEDMPTLDRSTVVLMLVTMADTTWRMFVPTVGLAYVGGMADTHWGTKPWLLLAGAAIGAGISAVLVRRQLQFTKKS